MNPKKLLLIFLALLLTLALSASALSNVSQAVTSGGVELDRQIVPAAQSDGQFSARNVRVQAAPAPDYSDWTLMAFSNGKYNFIHDIYIGPYGGEYELFTGSAYIDDVGPSLYPAGDRIVWSQDGSGLGTIYIAKLDGSEVTRLGEELAWDFEPAFSPDGSLIAYRGGPNIYVMNADGTGKTHLIYGCGSPDWSPDGSQIVMRCQGGIFTIHPDGTDLAQLLDSNNSGFPIWSQNGKWIAYADNGDIWRMDAADGGNRTMLYDFSKGNAYPCDWSPDSRMIAFRAVTYICAPEPYGCDIGASILKVLDSTNGHVTNISNNKSFVDDCSWVSMDQAAPSSAVDPLPADSRSRFTVRWSGTDLGSSGIEWYEVQVRDGETGAWEPLAGPTSSTSISFTGQVGHTYYFRSRAGDLAGNLEEYPATPDAWTTVTRK